MEKEGVEVSRRGGRVKADGAAGTEKEGEGRQLTVRTLVFLSGTG